ncbi:MAG: OmpA family protein [Thiobacillus sp.]|nr:OmpA family protein [Thiobacillus sp.]
MVGGVARSEAAEGRFYDPSNAASPTGFTIGHELFRTIGCPGRQLLDIPCVVLDSDGDGVFDYMDKCPDTPAGTKVDAAGCPFPAAAEPAPAPVPAPAALAAAAVPAMTVLAGVNFDFDQSIIRPEDFEKLDRDVATLKDWGDVKVEVAGHTDSVGTDDYNMGLSLRRAESVRVYLVDKGIAADRLSVRGYGESQPVADNATDEGRFMNRRVELIPQK